MTQKLVKPVSILIGQFIAIQLLPDGPVDPWNIFNLKKMSQMILALTLIQYSSVFVLDWLGSRVGGILNGFLGGLVSSTATTAALAKRSQLVDEPKNVISETLTFLAATIAMLFEGAAILFYGTEDFHASVLILFFGPAAVAGFLIYFNAKKVIHKSEKINEAHFDFLPILKLSVFIILILSASKLLQHFLGESGLLVWTFVVSLFEIHGSFISNVQLHDSGAFNSRMLGNLAGISIAASYLSKLFLIYTLGSLGLRKKAKIYTAYLFLALVVSWVWYLMVDSV